MEFPTVNNWNSPETLIRRHIEDQTPYSVAYDLGLHYLPMSHKKDARHIWFKVQLFCLSHKSCRNLGSIHIVEIIFQVKVH